jgi:MFS family permease
VKSGKYGLNLSAYFGVFLSAVGYGISFPLLSISLESMAVSGQDIGVNAAMPALGWLIGSYFLPNLLFRFGLKQVLIVCLLTSALSILMFFLTQNLTAWMLLRFLFGGSIGLFYRTIEFWINAISKDDARGKNIGFYSVYFVLGLTVGSSVQPFFGVTSFLPFAVISALLGLTVVVFARQFYVDTVNTKPSRAYLSLTILLATPIALTAVFAFGFFESIPAYFLAAYALRNNLSESVAAYTPTAAVVGVLVFAIPIGYLSDRVNRNYVLITCAIFASIISAIIPQTVSSPTLFLVLIAIWCGFANSIYNLGLSIIGEKFSGESLSAANASFGIVYAVSGLVGPLVNGFAIDQVHSQGLMISAGMTFAIFVLFAVGVTLKYQKYVR